MMDKQLSDAVVGRFRDEGGCTVACQLSLTPTPTPGGDGAATLTVVHNGRTFSIETGCFFGVGFVLDGMLECWRLTAPKIHREDAA